MWKIQINNQNEELNLKQKCRRLLNRRKGVDKKLLCAALTKGSFYPIVKKIASWFGTRMTKQMFAGFFKNTIPVVDGVIGGGITFLSFKPCCDKLKDSLRDTMLANTDFVSDEEEAEDFIIDISLEE